MKTSSHSTARFNVSDALDVPLRGFLLRLRRTEGTFAVKDLVPGSQLRLTSPTGLERVVTVRAKSLTGGRNTQERLEKTGQIDVIIGSEDAYADGEPIGIGWAAEGPVHGEDGKPLRRDVEPIKATGVRRRPTRDSATGGWPFNTPGGH
jgi:hypothetical protein